MGTTNQHYSTSDLLSSCTPMTNLSVENFVATNGEHFNIDNENDEAVILSVKFAGDDTFIPKKIYPKTNPFLLKEVEKNEVLTETQLTNLKASLPSRSVVRDSTLLNPFWFDKIPSDDDLKTLYNPNILGFWPLNDASGTAAVDISGNGYNALYRNTVILNQDGINEKKSTDFAGTGNLRFYGVGLTPNFPTEEGYFSIIISANAATSINTAGITLFYFQVDANNSITVSIVSAGIMRFSIKTGGTGSFFDCKMPLTTRWMNIGFRWSRTNSLITAFLNGIAIRSVAATLGTWVGTPASWDQQIMSGGGEGQKFPAKSLDAYILKYAPTNEEIFDSFKPIGLINCVGDSRTYISRWQIDSVESVNKGIFSLNKYSVIDDGVSGDNVTDMANRAAATNARIISGIKNILIVWVGVNNIGDSASTIYTQLKNYCIAAKAAGWNKIVLLSEIDAQDVDRNNWGWHTTVLPALNILFDADHSFADKYVPLHLNAKLMNALDTNYFNADKVHLVTGGVNEVAAEVTAKISSLI